MTDLSPKRMLSGNGTLLGPSRNTQFNSIVELVVLSLPPFAESSRNEGISNENGLNRRLARFITNVADKRGLPYFAQTESMEDETRGNSQATDIGIHLKVEDIDVDPPKVTVFEGKRLSSTLGKERRCEYVVGHEKDGKHMPCGGIERFKLSLHGGKFSLAGMIGYLQDGTPESWRKKVNAWIFDLCNQSLDSTWSKQEQLTSPITDGRVSVCSSVVNRVGSDLHLTHLWIDLV